MDPTMKAEIEAVVGAKVDAATAALLKEFQASRAQKDEKGKTLFVSSADYAGKFELIDMGKSAATKRRLGKMISSDKHKGVGFALARFCIAAAIAADEKKSTVDAAKGSTVLDFSDQELGLMEEARDVAKFMQASQFSTGGNLIPIPMVAEFIQLLQQTALLLTWGLTDVTILGESVDIPRITSGTTAVWVGENEAPTLSDVGTGQKSLTLRELAAASIMSRRLLRGAANVEQIVRNQLARDFGIALSITGWRSAGGVKKPRGLRYLLAPGNVVAETGVTLAATETDLYGVMGKVDDAYVMGTRRWAFHNRVARGLAKIGPAVDNAVRPYKAGLEEMTPPMLLGKEVTICNEFPTNLGGGADTEILYGAPEHFWHGVGEAMTVQVTTEGAVKDGSVVRSMFSERALAIQLAGLHDFNVAHPEAFACIPDSTLA